MMHGAHIASIGGTWLALTGARLRFVHDLGRGGIIVSLRQVLEQIREQTNLQFMMSKEQGERVGRVSVNAENATVAAGFLDPGMAMITKPFAVDTLAQKIRSIIKGDTVQ